MADFPNASKVRVTSVTAENFQREVLLCQRPVLLHFASEQSRPSCLLSPILNELAAEHPEWKVCRVDVHEQGALAARFGIRGTPTVLLLQNGMSMASSVGLLSKQSLLSNLGLQRFSS